MAENIIKLKVDSDEYQSKIKRASEGLLALGRNLREAGKTFADADAKQVEFTSKLGKMETTANTARGKLAEMTKAFTEMSVQYKNMTEEEKNGEFGKALNASLNELKGRIQESKTQLDDVSKSLNSGGGLSGALDAVAGKFGLSIEQVTKFGSVLGVATTAAQVAKDAFFQSESGIDEWGRTVEGAKGAYNIFLDTLNNGNWSNFFQNLQTAIQGGRDLYDIFDRLGSIKSNNAAAIAMVQQQIAQLRLAKQQGENVDAQLKEATARLAQLQKQSITAGMAAGNKSAFEVIRNGVNSVGGARYNDATINYVIGNIMKNGQSEFDKYRNNYETLRNRGMVTKTQTIYDSQGGTYERQYKEFDINALTKEQQKQYSLAKAITEGETRIQKGIAAYAQAVQEGTASAREEFKGNRYAIQGAGGGSKGGSGGGKVDKEVNYASDSIAAQSALVSELNKKFNESGEAVRNGMIPQLVEAEQRLKAMRDNATLLKEQAQGKLLGGDVQTTDLGNVVGIPDIGSGLSEDTMKYIKNLNDGGKDVSKSWTLAASAMRSVGSAMSGLKNPAIDIMTVIGQSIASIALAYAENLAGDKTTKGNIWAFIAAAAAATVSMATTIASLHSATGYAEGGIVKGNSYSGDNVGGLVDGNQLVGLNAGEVVLTKAMQGSLANQLEGNGIGNLNLRGVLQGENIIISVDRTLRRMGRGELMTWKG